MPKIDEVSEIAALLGAPARLQILLALGGGRALPAGELAACADVSASTASEHLIRLEQAGLLTVVRQGRHRYYRIASTEVAAMLEALMVVASAAPRTQSKIDPVLRQGRTCYNHLAGRLGVAICDAMVHTHMILIERDVACITERGLVCLHTAGIDVTRLRKHPYCRICIDWSERRNHLAGMIGSEIHRRCLEPGWIMPGLDRRAVHLTAAGKKGLQSVFGVEHEAL